MERKIKIGNKEFLLQSSLFTIIQYKKTFGKELFNDVKVLENNKNDEDNFSEVIDTIFKIVYILNKPYSNVTYDDFLKQIEFESIIDVETLENISHTLTDLLVTINTPNTTPSSK